MTKQPEIIFTSPFQRLSQINVNEHVEKKNGLSYLSWAWAVAELLKNDPDASWTYGEPVRWNDTVMVFCTVTAFKKPMTAQLPVMDHRNKAISNPDAFAVNTAMQRCLAKAIALHGLGLYIYAGEDIPESETEAFAKKASDKGVTPTAGTAESLSDADKEWLQESANRTKLAFEEKGVEAAIAVLDRFNLADVMDNPDSATEAEIYRWSLMDSKTRSAIKKEQSKPTADELTAQA